MMLEEFGKDYEAYMATSKRLVPGVWWSTSRSPPNRYMASKSNQAPGPTNGLPSWP